MLSARRTVGISGGYLTSGIVSLVGNLHVFENRPTSTTVWTVSAREDDAPPGETWTLQAFELCANANP